MMIISFSPQHRDDILTVSRQGDTLTVNGDALDLSAIPEGATLPREAIDNEWVAGPIDRIDGVLHVTLLLPHGPTPSQAVAFPEPIVVTADGAVPVPHEPEPEPEEAADAD